MSSSDRRQCISERSRRSASRYGWAAAGLQVERDGGVHIPVAPFTAPCYPALKRVDLPSTSTDAQPQRPDALLPSPPPREEGDAQQDEHAEREETAVHRGRRARRSVRPAHVDGDRRPQEPEHRHAGEQKTNWCWAASPLPRTSARTAARTSSETPPSTVGRAPSAPTRRPPSAMSGPACAGRRRRVRDRRLVCHQGGVGAPAGRARDYGRWAAAASRSPPTRTGARRRTPTSSPGSAYAEKGGAGGHAPAGTTPHDDPAITVARRRRRRRRARSRGRPSSAWLPGAAARGPPGFLPYVLAGVGDPHRTPVRPSAVSSISPRLRPGGPQRAEFPATAGNSSPAGD
jgi:hypothetical protein